MARTWTVRDVLSWTESYLGAHGDGSARLSAQWLVSDVLDCGRLDLYLDMDRPLDPDELARLHRHIERRANGEPLQYIVGKTDFRKISVRVRRGVLIPRPETEVLVSAALEAVRVRRAVDLCTGTGCIACSIATEVPGSHVVATDVSPDAVALAKENVSDLGLGDAVDVVQCDLGEGVPKDEMGGFDLVVSNPPYVPSRVVDGLSKEVVDFEPRLALDGGDDGLDLFRRIAPFSMKALGEAGVLACELFEESLDEARDIAVSAGFSSADVVDDLAGRPRVLVACKGDVAALNAERDAEAKAAAGENAASGKGGSPDDAARHDSLGAGAAMGRQDA